MLDEFFKKLSSSPNSIEFQDTITVIDALYNYRPTAFKNGELHNHECENEGSCKLFFFAKLHNLSESQTLTCFGSYYRKDVLKAPDGENHQNIRNFMQTGWEGIKFDHAALIKK